MNDEWNEADDVVEEVREVRRRIWARFGNDPEKVIDYYLELDRRRTNPARDVRKPDGAASRGAQ
jgi:hypothetical protein